MQVLKADGPTASDVSSWPVIGQFSSIGSLGAQPEAWLTTEWFHSLAAGTGTNAPIQGSRDRLKLVRVEAHHYFVM